MKLIKKIRNNPQMIRYGIVGSSSTAIDFGFLFLFKLLGVPVGLANIMSTGIAFIFSFFANKKFTFKTSGTSIIREMILFVVVTLFGLWVLQSVVIMALHDPMTRLVHNEDIALLFAKLAATLVSLTWNYLFYSKLVFKEKRELKLTVGNRPVAE